MREYKIGRLKGRFVVTWYEDDGRRRRYRLDAGTLKEAQAEALDLIRKEKAPVGTSTVADLWDAYVAEKTGRPVATTMRYTGLAILDRFGNLRPDQLSTQDCREYAKARRAKGISDGAIWTELGHLRTTMTWAVKTRLLDVAPYIERPQKPPPKERYLRRDEVNRLLGAEAEPHVRLAIILMLTTAGRVGAILELTWDRVDMLRGQINLRADAEGPRKGRAIVPMNGLSRPALLTAKAASLSEYVIEWAGTPVKSIRKGFTRTVERAGLSDVTPHVLRHTAAVYMAEGGVPMQKISQYLGHSSTAVTERTYARFAPDHLRDAAEILDFGRKVRPA